MINYRYRIVEKLGEGGSGEVFQIEDTLKRNRRLAIKILHSAEKVGAASDEAFRNEVSQLIKLSHPNLVRIFDFGLVRHAHEEFLLHRRFFTMEFVQGADPLEWIATSVPPARKEAFLEVVLLQTLSVLDYIHREGIIHFDVKPQNLVLVGEKGVSEAPLVKLMDFGFSKKREEVLDVSLRGTLEYTAPELLEGKAFDHRVDLYSLGATFFHLLEGRCPFEARNPVELVKHILSDEATFSTGGSSRLRAVIRGLMEKNPQRRFGSAEEAARALVSEMSSGNELLESYFGLARQPRFVGRKNELVVVHNAIDALGGLSDIPRPNAVVVAGGEGIGKTTFLREVITYARCREVHVYELEALANGIPFQAIASVLPLLGSDVRSFSNEGSAIVDRFARTLGLDDGDSFHFDLWGDKKDAFIETVSRFLGECSGVFPLVLVADDFQLADESSLKVLRTVLRDAPAGKIILLAAQSGEEPGSSLAGIAQMIRLEELTADEVTEMCTSALDLGPAAGDIGSLLFSLYGGTPGVLVEALNALADVVTPEELRNAETAKRVVSGLEARLPKNIDEFLLARFRKLSQERQLVVSIVACFQYPVRREILIRLLPFHHLRSRDHLRFLLLEGFLGSANADQVLFIRMKRLKDAIYDSIGREKAELHALIAATLEQHITKDDFTGLQEIAFQFSVSGNHQKAALYYEQAAETGLERFALQRSVQLIEHAINESGQGPDRGSTLRLQVRRVMVLYRAGMFKEAVEAGSALLPLMQAAEHGVIWKYMGLSLSRLGVSEQAHEYISAALQHSTNEVERLELRQELVGLQIAAGHFKQAEENCREQLATAIGLKNNRLLGAIYTDLGIASFFQDRFDDAVHYFAEALKVYELRNEKSQVTNAINNIGNALSAKGDYREAIRYWERALKASLDFGTLNQQAQIYSNLGIAHYNLKQYSKAKEFYATALDLCRRTDSKTGLANGWLNLGEVLIAEGEYEAALQALQDARQIYESMNSAHMLVEACLDIADIYARIGDIESMGVELHRVAKLIEENDLETFVAAYDYLVGIWNQRKGRWLEAEQAFQRVCDRARTGDPKGLYHFARVHGAECRTNRGENVSAAREVLALLRDPFATSFPLVVAEANYLLGIIANVCSDAVPEKAIVYFKRGMDAIAKEPVCETTWKLAYALAHAYHERGQYERAREFLTKARLVLKYFLSHFRSDELKRKYLAADHRDRVLATIESLTPS